MELPIPAVRIRRRVRHAGRILLCLWLTAFFIVGPGVAPEVRAFSIQDEIELGEKFHIMIHSRLPLIQDPEVVDYMNDMMERVQANVPLLPFPIQTYVIKHSSLNAFAAPAGHMYVFSGLILTLESESQLAGVMAHELAHVSQRHIAKHIEEMETVSLLTLAGMLAAVLLGGGEATEAMAYGSIAAGQTAMLKFSRDDERDADNVGMNYLVKAGYRAQGMVESFETIRRQQWATGAGGLPTYLSTHPGITERIGYLYSRVDSLPVQVQERKDDNVRFKRIQTIIRARYTDPKSAIRFFLPQDGQAPTCAEYMGQGIAYDRMNKVGQAKEAFAKALECAGTDDQLLVREYGRFCFERGDFDNGSFYLRRALELNPDDLMALFFYARLLGEEKKTREASEYYLRVLRKLPEDPEVHYYYGRMLGEGKKFFDAHLHLAYSAVYMHDEKQIEFHMDKAKRLAQTAADQEAYDKLEKIYEERSDYW